MDSFKLNKYDPCVANKDVDGNQCTVCWYVDDNKISHEDPKGLYPVIEMIESKFSTMTKRRDKKHTFVGMDMRFIEEGKVKIPMKEYMGECIVSFGENLGENTTKTPAKGDLFKVDETSEG